MTPVAKRIAIATFIGWKQIPAILDQPWGYKATFREWSYVHQLPDYLNDLNAMHNAEAMLKEHDQARYQALLVFAFVGPSDHYPLFSVIHATAAQRAEAFLRTIGKWTDQ